MKFDTYSDYDPRATSQTLPAFLTVWPGLGNYHDDLVLLGGMVPLYLCEHPTGEWALPRPATLDVDFGISLGASAGQYGTLATDLRAQGFRPSATQSGRFEREVAGFTVYVDFLVEDGEQPRGTRLVDDVPASVMPGVVRALQTARRMPVTGTDLYGAEQRVVARVCEVGPFLVLKLRAFFHRQQGKDAFDLLYTLLHYDGGTQAAIAAFGAEAAAGNPAMPDARRALETLFADENAPGPVKAAHFVYGPVAPGEAADTRLRRLQLRQDVVGVTAALMAAGTQ
ncbi:MAG: hypothetical protein H7067_08315 [Burkholderiales bacterium]|nr:hypothetical protein [Opitutaceae bacterium]